MSPRAEAKPHACLMLSAMSKVIEIRDDDCEEIQITESPHSVPELPPEIWSLIMLEVRPPRYRDLWPLLCACSSLYHLAAPLVYEHVKVRIEAYRYQSLHILQSLSSSPYLHYTTQFDIIMINVPNDPLSRVLSSMNSLERLSLKGLNARHFEDSPLASITSALTHFICTGSVSAEVISSFLGQQSSLRYLELRVDVDAADLNIPADAMPNLKTFVGSPKLWATMTWGGQIEHLDDKYTNSSQIPTAPHVYRHLRSLRTDGNIGPIVEYLENLEYFGIMNGWEYYSYREWGLRFCLSIPSIHLRYAFLGTPHTPSLARVKRTFDKFPQLKAIDYRRSESQLEGYVLRYVRDQEAVKRVKTPLRQTWRPWWRQLDL